LIELLSIYNGRNNGYIALSARDAAERIGCSKDTANRAFVELRAIGFVEVSIVGAFHRKTATRPSIG
jgi:DNA-binding transcriptional regulator YhcF (GntR family)